jgi:WhiB family redox-sensing transcriptional regulator
VSDWRHRAGCRDTDPELFFPTGTTGPAADQIQEAKAVCALCPVQGECLEWALGAGSQADYGIWGGLDEAERRSLRRKRLRTPPHGNYLRYLTGCRCALCKRTWATRNREYTARTKAATA